MTTLLELSRLESLLESAQLLHSSLNLEELLQHLLRSVMGRLLIKRGLIAVAGDEQMRIALVRGIRAITVGDTFDEVAIRKAGVNLIFPIGGAEQPIGFLGIGSPASGSLNKEDEEFLKALLGIAASGIANARAHAKAYHLNQALEQKVQDLRALLELARGLTAMLDPESVARLLVLTLAGRWAVRKYAIAVWKEGQPTIQRCRGMELPTLERLKQALITLPEAIRVEELPEGYVKKALTFQQGSLLFVLRSSSTSSTSDDSINGVVVLGSRPGQLPYSEADLEFGSGLVAQAWIALQNAWYFREAVERKRIEAMIQAQKQTDMVFSTLADVLAGTVLDEKYHLESKIGTGGFGAVYQAIQLGLNRPVAVKIFRPMAGFDVREGFNNFRMEGIAASRLNHPNSVSILDFGISKEGIAYLVMELLNGHTLAKELELKRRLSLARCAEILIPVCNVLSELHALGIVHRDIKPDNIFLHKTKDKEVVKLVDFGIAKIFETKDETTRHLTLAGQVFGTPAYISPERFQKKPYDGRADIYSLGVVFYEMLCGSLPFDSPDDNPYKIAMMHLNAEPRPLRELNPDIPEAVERVVLKALQKNPGDRPTAKELADEFIQKDY